jgi:hypothetical protein
VLSKLKKTLLYSTSIIRSQVKTLPSKLKLLLLKKHLLKKRLRHLPNKPGSDPGFKKGLGHLARPFYVQLVLVRKLGLRNPLFAYGRDTVDRGDAVDRQSLSS